MPGTMIFYFDLSSTYSYMAATQVEGVAARAKGTVIWTPVVLGAIFKQVGNVMPATIPAKASWMLKDLDRWAQYYGVGFKMNPHFPINAMTAHRAIVAAQLDGHEAAAAKLARACFDSVWVHGADITQEEVLAELIAEVGLEPEGLLPKTQDQQVKDKLRQNTEAALAHGVFGAPAFVINDELIWGNDRLHFAEALLSAQRA